MFGMRCYIVHSEEELKEKVEDLKTENYKLAAISNAGLKSPAKRITFLPVSAFKESYP